VGSVHGHFTVGDHGVSLPLQARAGHLYAVVGSEWWLLDTGSPGSFGASTELQLSGAAIALATSYRGLDAAALTRQLQVPCVGLLGADVLSRFDHVFDLPAGRLDVSDEPIAHEGRAVHLDEFMGIPILDVRLAGSEYRMLFDTGARYCYLQSGSLVDRPVGERVTDYYLGIGTFQAETHLVELDIGGEAIALCCGRLPESLGAALMLLGVDGIIGNELLMNRQAGYFPRRHELVL
jgi:hypothetical protein